MKLDVLAFGAHPDDVELGCAGTIAKMVRQGKKVGIVDLTLGELATRGDVAIREEESKKAASILGIQYRVNLNLGDGFLEINEQNILKLIVEIRRHRPTTILANAPKDRHPDHEKSAELVKRANFLSGLKKIDTRFQSKSQEAHRTQKLFHYIQDYYLEPNFCIDITDFMPIKEKAIKAYSSQFYNPNVEELDTPISKPSFLKHIEGRAIQFGRYIQKDFAEGFLSEYPFEQVVLPH